MHLSIISTDLNKSVFPIQHPVNMTTDNAKQSLLKMVIIIYDGLCCQTCSTKSLRRKKPGNNFGIDYILWMSLIMVRMQTKLSCEDTVLPFYGQHVKLRGAAWD